MSITTEYGLSQVYIAGFVDGEGCFSIYKHQDKRIGKGYTYFPKFSIRNTNKYILTLIKKELGGRVFVSSKGNDKSRVVYGLEIQDLETIECAINKIDAHLILKKKQAEILLKYCKIRKEGKNYSKKEEKLYNKIKELNKRGKGIGYP
jgi:hypothetical protein